MRARLFAAAVAVSCFAGCHDFSAAYRDCFDGGRCATADGGAEGDGGAPDGGSLDGGSSDGGSPDGGQADGGVDAGPATPAGLCFAVEDAGACWESPLPFGFHLTGAAVRGPGDVWFVGEHGAVVHLDGGSFEFRVLGTSDLISVASDGQRVLAVSGKAVVDLLSGATVPFSAPDAVRHIDAIGPDGFIVSGGNYGGQSNAAAEVYSVDAGTLELSRVYSERADAGLPGSEVTGCAGVPGNLYCSVGGQSNLGRLWHQVGASWQTQLDLDGGAELFSVAIDSAQRQWVGSTGRYYAGVASAFTAYSTGLDSSEAVTSIAAGDFVSLATNYGRGLRCTAPGSCAEVVPGTGMRFFATATIGDQQYFAGRGGALQYGSVDAGFRLAIDARAAQVMDFWKDLDGTVWAGVADHTLWTGELWRREGTRWVVAAHVPREINSVGRVGGSLVLATSGGLFREQPDHSFALAVIFLPDGGAADPGLALYSVKPVGAGGWAVGENGLSMRFEGGEWVRRDDGSGSPGFAMGHIVALDGGGAVAVGALPDGGAGMQWLTLDGGTSMVAALPTVGDLPFGATLLADGRVLFCARNGDLVAGTPSSSFVKLQSPLTQCGSLLTTADGGLYAGTSDGLARLSFYSAAIVQAARYPIARWVASLQDVSDGILLGSDDNAIVRVHP